MGSGATTLHEVGALSDEQLVSAGVPRKSWAAVRAGVTLLLAEKAVGIVPAPSSPLAAATRLSARARAKGAAAASRAGAATAAAAAARAPAGADEADGDAEAAGDPMEIAELTVLPDEADLRLDRLLVGRFELQSRTYFASLCAQGLVTMDGMRAAKGDRLRVGAVVSVQFTPTAEMEARPERMPLDILYEDAHLLVLNKAAGVVVHPAPGHWEGTLVNGVLFHLLGNGHGAAGAAEASGGAPPSDESDESDEPDALRAPTSTVVHRLDKGTTGAIAFAKSAESQRALSSLFRLRQVRKSYLAVCVGDPGADPIEITHPIGRDKANRLRMTVVAEADGGRSARSVVRRLCYDGRFSLVRVDIFTGRTHQIRVHMRAHGLPLVGDDEYGSKQWNQAALKGLGVRRPLLHAHRLAFEHPFTQRALAFEAPLPDDLRRAIDSIYARSRDGGGGGEAADAHAGADGVAALLADAPLRAGTAAPLSKGAAT